MQTFVCIECGEVVLFRAGIIGTYALIGLLYVFGRCDLLCDCKRFLKRVYRLINAFKLSIMLSYVHLYLYGKERIMRLDRFQEIEAALMIQKCLRVVVHCGVGERGYV